MKTVDSNKQLKHPQPHLRPSHSLHGHLLKNRIKQPSGSSINKNMDTLTVCILYKKKKIQLEVKRNTCFEELNKILYKKFY
jgi:hypothetical protein